MLEQFPPYIAIPLSVVSMGWFAPHKMAKIIKAQHIATTGSGSENYRPLPAAAAAAAAAGATVSFLANYTPEVASVRHNVTFQPQSHPKARPLFNGHRF